MSYKIAGIVGAVAVVGLGWFFFYAQTKHSPSTTPSIFAFSSSTQRTDSSKQTAVQPPHTTLYKSANYSFILFYPNDLSADTYPEAGGASTITFQNVKEASGFQIFIVPYDGDQISQERFEADDPSGVMGNATDVAVDGTKAVKFYSEDALLGDTVEIWFLKNHFLFEVSAPRAFEAGLTETMSTWHFF